MSAKNTVVVVVEGGVVQEVMLPEGFKYVLIDHDSLNETEEDPEAEARRLCEEEGGYNYVTGEPLPEKIDPNESVLACPHCRSTEVGMAAFCDPNSDELVDWDEKGDARECYWCGELEDGEHLEAIQRFESKEWTDEHPIQLWVVCEAAGTKPQWGVFKVEAAKDKNADDYESLLGVRDSKEEAIELARRHASLHAWPIGVRELIENVEKLTIIE